MSLIEKMSGLARQMEATQREAEQQQRTYFALVDGVVRLRQRLRVEKKFAEADELRALLEGVGIQVVDGTAGCAYEQIPPALRGRPVGDQWVDGSVGQR